MYLTPTPDLAAHPLQVAVDAVGAAVEDLVKLVEDDAHTDLGACSLVEVMQSLETVRNTLPVVDGALIQHGSEQGVAESVVGTDHDRGVDVRAAAVER